LTDRCTRPIRAANAAFPVTRLETKGGHTVDYLVGAGRDSADLGDQMFMDADRT